MECKTPLKILLMRLSLLLLTLVLLVPAALSAQESASSGISSTTDSDAVYQARIEEIYTAAYLENVPELRAALTNLLKNRVSYVIEPASVNNKYPLISSLPLMNKMNPAVVSHDPAGFDPTTFNPLTYRWNFFSDKLLVYRIDGTDYLLIVQPQ